MAAELRGGAKARPPVAVFAREWALLESLQDAQANERNLETSDGRAETAGGGGQR